MTCIVGLSHGGKVYIGGDSCGSNGHTFGIYGQRKVFKVDAGQDQFLIGCTSSFRMIDLLTHQLDGNVSRSHPDDSDDKFIRTTFIAGIRSLFKEGGFSNISDNEETGGNFLLGYNGNLYEVQDDFSVLNPAPWGMAIGSGEEAARGALWINRKQKDPKKRVIEALEAAEANIAPVRGPMYCEVL